MPAVRAAVYLRVSSEEQAENHSLSAQRKACLALAEARGWPVVAVFEDPGESAAILPTGPFYPLLVTCGPDGGPVRISLEDGLYGQLFAEVLARPLVGAGAP